MVIYSSMIIPKFMSVLVFAIVKNITNNQQYEKYAKENFEIVKKYGGKFLYRNNNREHIEGSPIDDRVVILEFDNSDNAKKWYNSIEYQEAKNIRKDIAEASIYILDSFQ